MPNCGIQYVGQTGQFLFKRTQQHLYRFRRHKKYKNLVYQHLNKHKHDIQFITVQPLEIVKKARGQSHKQHEKERKVCELSWIKKLQTAYPLGLNDNIMGLGNISTTSNIDIMDIVSKKSRNKRSHGKRINRNKRKFHRNSFSLSNLLSIFKNNGRHNLLNKLCTIPVLKLNSLLEECNSISHASPKYEAALIISAFCYHKLYPKIDKPEDHIRHFLKLSFVNKGIDLIDLSSVFRDSSVINKIPAYFDNTEPPILSYTYKKPTRGMIFNYTSITTDMDINNSSPLSCNCNNSKFRYEPSGHIITGDLNIVQDREVKSFLQKGPKYRPPSKIDWKECRSIIDKALNSYCKKWIKRENADKKSLDDFVKKCMEIVDVRIKHHETNYKHLNTKTPISRIKNKLKELGKEFVFVPADKAANNVVVV